jgi:hypothetical protein
VAEVRFEDLILGDVIVSFDGQAVELFIGDRPSERFHRLMLTIQISGPTKKGNYVVDLSHSVSGRGGVKLSVAGADWPNVEPLAAALLGDT